MSDKMKKMIMVCENNKLFEWIKRETKLYTNSDLDFEQRVNGTFEYMIRGRAEEDFDYKQPLPYWIIIDEKNRVFVYQRWWAWSNNWESRLNNKISFWVWGHIDEWDFTENILRNTLKREIEEEINLKEDAIKSIEIIWYINIDNWKVEEVHFWLAYLVRVNNSNIKLLDWELDNWEFISVEELDKMASSWNYDIELWSQILLEPLKNILNK